MLSFASYTDFPDLRVQDTFMLTATVWLTAAAFGALPLYMWSLSFSDAFFEAMSAVTTTGSTVMSGLDTTPHDILLWRGILQWLGGLGFIVTGMALLPILKVGGMQLFRTESSDKGDKELRNAAVFASATLQVYLCLMGVCALVYVAGGMGPFDAITHAMTTLSTGGYSGYDASFGHFQSPFLQWAGTFFMLCAGLPFVWFIRAARVRSLRSEQVHVYLVMLMVVIFLLTAWLVLARGFDTAEALRLVAFNVVSAVTTTGYATTDYTAWGSAAVVVFFLLTASGGCTGSTSGGAKMMRWIILARSLKRQYIAVVNGSMVAGGTVDEPIGRHRNDRKRMVVRGSGRPSVTHYRVREHFRAHTALDVNLETGRTHQIRVHMTQIDHPLVGDPVYGRRLRIPPGADDELIEVLRGFRRQALHAAKLGLEHPRSGEYMEWKSPLPQDMRELNQALRDDAELHDPYRG